MKILNTIICYNNANEVVTYIKSMMEIEREHLVFAITINAGSQNDRDILEEYSLQENCSKINIYDPGENLGYLNGMLYGYNKYINENDPPDLVIMSNTDIQITDKDFFSKIEKSQYSKEIGCIGPSVYVPFRKTYENPVNISRTPKSKINRLIAIMSIPLVRGAYVRLSDVKGRITKRHKAEYSGYVYEVHGCYFILTNIFLKKINEKPYGALLYSEEAYIAENIIKYGFRTYYDANIEVEHLEHSVTGGLKSERIAKHIKETMQLIRSTFY